MKVWAGALALFFVGLTPRLAEAGGCCMSASAFGVGRLKAWEDAVVGSRLSYAGTYGNWTNDALWYRNALGYSESETRAELFGILRVAERWQLSALLPWLRTTRDIGGQQGAGAWLGDGQASLRWSAIEHGDYEGVPLVGVTASVILPSGRRAEESRAPLDTGATGRGVWGEALAVEVEKVIDLLWLRAEVGYTNYFMFLRPDLQVAQKYGPTFAAALSGGYAVSDDLGVALAATYAHDAPLMLAGRTINESTAASTNVSVSANWNLDEHWSVLANAGSGVYVNGFGRNRPGRLSASLGVRFGRF